MDLARTLLSRGAALCLCAAVLLPSPAARAAGPVVAALQEQWRAGGEDDAVFFGSVGAVKTDAAGDVLLLDSQLSEVHVYSPAGEHLATLGREGDGPGEVRRPGDMAVLPDGTVALIQGFPGRIVLINRDGTPAGESAYTPPGGAAAGQFAVLIRAMACGDGLALAGIRMSFGGGSQSRQTYFLSLCDAKGAERKALVTKDYVIDYADLRLDEAAGDFIWGRVAVGPDGRVYAAPERDAYAIKVFAPDGSEQREIRRDYRAPARTRAQRENATKVLEAVGANYPAALKGTSIQDTEPAVSGLWVTDDGRLWVATGRGGLDAPDGTWIVLDVFGPDGAFQRQVALPGAHDPDRDALHILPDGRVAVVVGALDAWLNQQAVGSGEGGGEGSPLEVICYRMDGV